VEIIKFAEESLESFWADAKDLLAMHWHEIATFDDIALSVNIAAYEQAEKDGKLCVICARTEDGVLVGYAVFFLVRHMHYQESLTAMQDVLYVHPVYRGGTVGSKLITRSEQVLRAKGCQVVHQHVKVAHPALGMLLERKGYQHVEALYVKRLDR
jgi:GNAT superfamily N-acetyltransferase